MINRFEAFTASVVTLNRCLQKVKDMEMKKFGLRAAHTMCLYYLGQHEEGLTSSELTKLCREDKAAISRSVSLLIEKGFVCTGEMNTRRAYRTKLYLTGEGKSLISKINARIECVLSAAGEGLSNENREIFYETMDLIAGNLQRYMDSGGEET